VKVAYAKYLLSLLLFGMNGIVAARIALSSYETVFWRTLIGSVMLLVILVASGKGFAFLKPCRSLAFLVAGGMSMGVSWVFLYEAYQQVGVSVSTLEYYFGPVLMMLLSPLLFRERLTWVKVAGFGVVLVGLFLVNGGSLAQGGSVWGLVCGGLAAVGLAGQVICNKKAEGITGLANATGQLVVGFLTVALFTVVKTGFAIAVPVADWAPMLVLGLVNTGAGCYFYYSSIGRLPIQSVAICGYLEPLSAVVFSVLLLHETMTVPMLLGGALILGGAAFGETVKRSGPGPVASAG
jgi:drug/metabolite transporter (DMT)-like permease